MFDFNHIKKKVTHNKIKKVDDKLDPDCISRNEGILLLRHRQEEVIAPYFIDLALELSQFTGWCAQESNVVNVITRTCRSIMGIQRRGIHDAMMVNADAILQQQQQANNRRKTRPQPWQYGDDTRIIVNSSSVTE